MKITRRRQIVWHTLAFLIFSILYLYIEKNLSINATAVDLTLFLDYLSQIKLLIVFSLITSFLIFNLQKISKIALLLLIGQVLYLMAMILYYDFNKFVFIMTLSYLLIAGYFYIFWSLELSKALYNPIFTSNDMDIRPLIPIEVLIKFNECNKEYQGHLCNWDEDSCFVLLDSIKDDVNDLLIVNNNKNKSTKVVVDFYYLDKIFSNKGEITAISNEPKGLGIELEIELNKINNPQFNFDFVLLSSTLNKMGFVPKEYHY
ncbi:MAG: hypothetical protein HQK51_07305 [Oligoflexia bacterium]|nr:hypothetical protein [Oligoflexia bacterium]